MSGRVGWSRCAASEREIQRIVQHSFYAASARPLASALRTQFCVLPQVHKVEVCVCVSVCEHLVSELVGAFSREHGH